MVFEKYWEAVSGMGKGGVLIFPEKPGSDANVKQI